MQERERTRPVCEPALTVSPLIATFHARRHASRCRRERRRADLSAPSETANTPTHPAATRRRDAGQDPSSQPNPRFVARRREQYPALQIVLQFALLIQLEQTPDSFRVYISANGTETSFVRRFHPLFLGLPLPSPSILSFAREQHKFPRQQLLKLISR